MAMPGQNSWGGDPEISAFANLTHWHVYLWNTKRNVWTHIEPQDEDAPSEGQLPSVFLIYTGNHYQAVNGLIDI